MLWVFFISPSNSPNRNLSLCACTQTYTHICEEMELLCFLLSYCCLLFFCSLCLWELGSFPHSQWLLEKGSFFFYLMVYFSNTFKYCSAIAFPLPCKQAKWICQGLLTALGERRITYGSQPTAVSLRNWSCCAVSE